MESTLIIGNGFDLDLGLKTSYKDFRNSELWPIHDVDLKDYDSLQCYLHKNTMADNWFDLEDLLYQFAYNPHRTQVGIKKDKALFKQLSDNLCEFIKKQEDDYISNGSLASSFFKYFSKFNNIFSFNFTDANVFSKYANSAYYANLLSSANKFIHVHGICKDCSSILGIGDNYKINKSYYFLYKTSSPYYKSSNVRYALQRSKLVVFYGHSLGPQDYHYFSHFFKCQSSENMVEADKKIIVFITKNKRSRDSILYQLREMNDGKIDLLYDCNDIRWIYTENDVSSNLKEFNEVIKTLSSLKNKQMLSIIGNR